MKCDFTRYAFVFVRKTPQGPRVGWPNSDPFTHFDHHSSGPKRRSPMSSSQREHVIDRSNTKIIVLNIWLDMIYLYMSHVVGRSRDVTRKSDQFAHVNLDIYWSQATPYGTQRGPLSYPLPKPQAPSPIKEQSKN